MIVDALRKEERQDISKPLLHMIKSVKKETNDIRMTNLFCIELYELIYHHIVLRRIRVAKKVFRLLEHLALPAHRIGEDKRKETFKRVRKIRL